MMWIRHLQRLSTPFHTPLPQSTHTTSHAPHWRLFRGSRPRWKNRRAGLIGSGRRKGQALIKRLAQQERGISIAMNRRTKVS